MGIAAAGAASLPASQLTASPAGDAIRPFRIDVPEEALIDLRRRLRQPAGLNGKQSRMNRKACSWRGFRNSRAIGGQIRLAQVRGKTERPHGDGYGQPAAAITSAVLGRTINGHPAGDLTRDDVLDDFTLYWLTNTALSAARFYWESHINLYNAADVSIPAAVSVFPGENYQAPRSWAERAYHKLIQYNEVDKGGHYAAWEQPQLFSQEVRAGFRPLRK
jgi:hypothetical protein